jgi:BirA family biotin operon repressor/biotin-[acetyl-CoA-carboxylase] ligase
MTGEEIFPAFYTVIRHDRVASTNDEAKSLAAAGAAEGMLVWAREQTAGRGRLARQWISRPGNLYASLILRPDVPIATAAQLGFAAALAIGETCLAFAPEAAIAYKWPNDVLLDGKKLAGILMESQATSDGRLAWLVIGMGVNLATYPVNVDRPATAFAATGADVGSEAMLIGLARCFLPWYERWRDGQGFAALREAWLARAQGLGQAIRVALPHDEFTGRFAGLDADGALLLETGSTTRRVSAGDVFPAGP